MTKQFVLLALTLFTISVNAQTTKTGINTVEPYGAVDTSELLMKQCNFEKDANAMVLFDKADISINWKGEVKFIRHKRIKIFNDEGKNEADIGLAFFDKITDVTAETINLSAGKIEYTQVDPDLIFKKKLDKTFKKLALAFPNVRAGSIIEIQYTWKLNSQFSIPPWFFQSSIPVQYSAVSIEMDNSNKIQFETLVKQPFAQDTAYAINNGNTSVNILALKNVHSLVTEPYMTPEYANLQRVNFKLDKKWWDRTSILLSFDRYFGMQLDFALKNEKIIVKKADSIKNKEDKIRYIFTLVKDSMTFNNINRVYVDDVAQDAWVNKKGSATEINMILCRLLRMAKIEASPMLISTPDYGVADPTIESLSEYNKCVVMIPLDSTHYDVLDASNKHNAYNRIPLELLNTIGFIVRYKGNNYGVVYLKDNDNSSQELISVNADILPDGKINGSADVMVNNYNRDTYLTEYKKLGKDDYLKEIVDGDNNLKISDLEMDNMETDSVPLEQHFKFKIDPPSSDGNYIYLTPYLFNLGPNPFISDKRYNDIDFTYNNVYTLTGRYTIPQGYKVESLPQNQTMTLYDKSINVKRILQQDNGVIELHYVISHKKMFYHKEEYKGLHDFYKKMYEMLNEQIVLKKN